MAPNKTTNSDPLLPPFPSLALRSSAFKTKHQRPFSKRSNFRCWPNPEEQPRVLYVG